MNAFSNTLYLKSSRNISNQLGNRGIKAIDERCWFRAETVLRRNVTSINLNTFFGGKGWKSQKRERESILTARTTRNLSEFVDLHCWDSIALESVSWIVSFETEAVNAYLNVYISRYISSIRLALVQ
jgi:hypothetical protein